MTTAVSNQAFVDKVVEEVIEPAAEHLLAGRYFTDLREGKLSTRRLQGFSLQHTWFNRALLKGGALRMIKASDNDEVFMGALRGVDAEITHPDMCKKFGLAIGLTEEDFKNELPIFDVLAHTSVIVSSSLINPSRAAGRASALANEFIVQRYATEFYTYLRQAPYNISEDALEFFAVHGVVDVDHSKAAAQAIAEQATTERDRRLVWDMAKNMVRLKLAKFEGIYDAYA